MRIISGTFKGHRFHPPAEKWPTRPTTDISKEGLFNILHNQLVFQDLRMLDLFGGTGNHGFEFISRGCSDVTYVDKHRPAVRFVHKQAELWNIKNKMTVILKDVKRFIHQYDGLPFDYIFAGPPYPLPWLDQIPSMIQSSALVAPSGIFVLEHNPNHNFEGEEQFQNSRNYGETIFSFFKARN